VKVKINDKFNLSNDSLYLPKYSSFRFSSLERSKVEHSIPGIKVAIEKNELSEEELRNFHRPKKFFPRGMALSFVEQKKKHKKRNELKHKKDI